MTRLSAAMVRMLARVPDGPAQRFLGSDLLILEALESRGMVTSLAECWYYRTPFGRETAERLAERTTK